MKKIKKIFGYSLLLIIGLILGLIVHGLIEIPFLWLLRTRFIALFMEMPWFTWLRIHWAFTVITEILGITVVSLFYKKLVTKKNYLLETVIIVSYFSFLIIILISLFNCPVLNK